MSQSVLKLGKKMIEIPINSKTEKCLDCGHEHNVSQSNILEDYLGKYLICDKCESSFDIE